MQPFLRSVVLRLRALWMEYWQGSWQLRAYRLVIAAVIALGVVLRLVGQVSNRSSLWFDEATWATRLMREPLLSLRIRPPGFTWLVKQLAEAFGPTEFWLRFVSNVAAILALLFVPYVASQLLKSRLARLILIFTFALHPALIDFSKEFKPYSFEVLVHLVPLLLFLRYRQTRRRAYFYGFLAVLPLLFVFAYSAAFSYPGWLLLGLCCSWREHRVRGLRAPLASGVACLGVVGLFYATMLGDIASDRKESYWGRKYDVFYQAPKDDPDSTHADWLVRKYTDIAALPGLRRELWDAPSEKSERALKELAAVERLFWAFLHAAAVVWIVRRRRLAELLLFVAPLITLAVVNTAGKWPMGAFRTNLYLCAYALPLAALGADVLVRRSRNYAWAISVLVIVLHVVPGFAFGFDWHRHKRMWTRDHQERELLERLRAHREEHLKLDPKRPRERLLLDPHTADSHKFYLNLHPDVSAKHREFFKRNFATEYRVGTERRMIKRIEQRLASERQPLWVVVSKPSDMAPVRERAAQLGRIVLEERLGEDHLILLVGKKP